MHTDYGERFTGRADGVSLNASGEAQARALGKLLASEPLAAVYSSPRERARATADAIAEPHGRSVDTVEALDEIDLGDWTGKRIVDLEGTPDFICWNEQRAVASPPNGETIVSVADRVEGFARATVDKHAGKIIALVSHADVIRALVARCLGLDFNNMLRFEVGPGSVSRLLFGNWGSKLLALNEGAAA
jgi:probable phosphoglycerate mutase